MRSTKKSKVALWVWLQVKYSLLKNIQMRIGYPLPQLKLVRESPYRLFVARLMWQLDKK